MAGDLAMRSDDLVSMIDRLRPIVACGWCREATDCLESTVRPLFNELPASDRDELYRVADALVAALSRDAPQ